MNRCFSNSKNHVFCTWMNRAEFGTTSFYGRNSRCFRLWERLKRLIDQDWNCVITVFFIVIYCVYFGTEASWKCPSISKSCKKNEMSHVSKRNNGWGDTSHSLPVSSTVRCLWIKTIHIQYCASYCFNTRKNGLMLFSFFSESCDIVM